MPLDPAYTPAEAVVAPAQPLPPSQQEGSLAPSPQPAAGAATSGECSAAAGGEGSSSLAETSRARRKNSVLFGWNDDGAAPSKEGAGIVTRHRGTVVHRERGSTLRPPSEHRRLPAAAVMPAINFVSRLRSRGSSVGPSSSGRGERGLGSQTELPPTEVRV